MANGIKSLRYIQIGKETTAGTAVAATAIWRGMGTMDDQRTIVFPDEDIGYISQTDRAYEPMIGAAISFDEVEATFEQLPYVLNAGLKAVTGAQDGTDGSGYAYVHTAPTTAANTLDLYTIEGGDNIQNYEMEYAFVEKFKLSGKAGESWKVQADWVGRQVSKSTKTGSLTLDTVEEIPFSLTTLSIDTVGGTIGTTAVSATLYAVELDCTTGWHGTFTGDSKYFTLHNVDGKKLDVIVKFTYLHTTSAVAEYDAFVAQTPRQIRIESTGTALTTSGTFTSKTLRLDMAGKYETWDKLGDQNGDDIVVATFRARYDPTAALFFEPTVVNELTALT